jgi:predicted RND superfamily exporter protein
MNRIEKARFYAENLREDGVYVGKTISIADIVKETHQALNENRPEFYAIPQDPRLLAQELLLFENSGSDDLEDLVDSQFREARFTLKMPFVDAIHYSRVLDRIQLKMEEIFDGVAEVTITGETRMMSHLISILSVNLVRTYALAFAVITPLMVLLLGSLRMGLLSMIPNLAPVIITLGVMGWFGIPLEVFTILIGSIALGLAVDDTIHFMHNYRRYYERSGDAAWATRETLRTTGQALLFTSVVLASGFFIYMFASMRNLLHFGLLTGITILAAFLADLLLAPALMAIYSRQGCVPQAQEPVAQADAA